MSKIIPSNHSQPHVHSKKEVIPREFTNLLRFKLGTLVGKKVLPHALVGLEFWSNLPKKVQQMAQYDVRLERKRIKDAKGDEV